MCKWLRIAGFKKKLENLYLEELSERPTLRQVTFVGVNGEIMMVMKVTMLVIRGG